MKKYKKLSKEILEIDKILTNYDEVIRIINEKDKILDTEIISTCETQVIYKNDFFLSKNEKISNYRRKQKIGKILENEIEEETSNIKTFYDYEIRDKLIKVILNEKTTNIQDYERKKNSFLSLCSFRSDKEKTINNDDSNSSNNKSKEEESTCILI